MGLELCPGGELFDQIKRRGKLPLESARFYAAEVVDCLEHIHSEGVIHRDLKVSYAYNYFLLSLTSWLGFPFNSERICRRQAWWLGETIDCLLESSFTW